MVSKILRVFTVAVVSVMGFVAYADGPITVTQLPAELFTPVGFDDNDNTQFVIEGFFPNTCYRMGSHTVDINVEKREITVNNQAFFYPESLCLEVLVPYSRIVNLGVLSAGDYRIQFVGNDGKQVVPMGRVEVVKSPNKGPDDFLYAPVQNSYVNVKANGTAELILSGEYTNTCMEIEQVIVHPSKEKVIVVQPIMKEKDFAAPGCAQMMVPYTKKVDLAEKPTGRVLVHVRSLNGKSLNNIVKL